MVYWSVLVIDLFYTFKILSDWFFESFIDPLSMSHTNWSDEKYFQLNLNSAIGEPTAGTCVLIFKVFYNVQWN